MAIRLISILILLTLSFQLLGKSLSPADFNNQLVLKHKIDPQKKQRLLYFWASWCPDCRQKLRGELQAFGKKHPQLDILTVNVDRNVKRGRHFIKEEDLKLAVIRDENKDIRKKLSIFAVPSWALVTQKGDNWEVVSQSAGSDLKTIEKNISSLGK